MRLTERKISEEERLCSYGYILALVLGAAAAPNSTVSANAGEAVSFSCSTVISLRDMQEVS